MKLDIKTMEDLLQWIDNVSIEKNKYKIYYLQNCRYKILSLIHEENNDNFNYSWVLTPNYNITKSFIIVFPMKDSNHVKYFKTESGCKRNLKKYLIKVSETTNIFINEIV